jgi:hypothetical protein
VPVKPPFGEQPDQPLEPEEELLHSMQFYAILPAAGTPAEVARRPGPQ